jgi:ribosomal protein S7
MINETKIQTLNELINTIPSNGKRNFALKLINELIDEVNVQEKKNDYLNAKKIGMLPVKYDTVLEKMVDLLQLMGFDLIDIEMLDFDAMQFFKLNRSKIKKPLTADYINNLILLYRFHVTTEGKKPESLKDLKDAYTEIEANRE